MRLILIVGLFFGLGCAATKVAQPPPATEPEPLVFEPVGRPTPPEFDPALPGAERLAVWRSREELPAWLVPAVPEEGELTRRIRRPALPPADPPPSLLIAISHRASAP